MKRTLYTAVMIALSSAAFLPAQSMAQVDVSIVIGNAPPPPRFESVPQPRRGYAWAPGYWNWDGQRHVWAAGQWQQERNGQQYQRAEWVRDNNNWRLNRGGWIGARAQPVNVDYVSVAPPRIRYERTPRPRDGYLWTSGHWEWRGQRHDWVPGVWIAERPGYSYSPANWTQRDGRWYMEQSRWSPRGGRGDRDHDGIPNRYDRDNDRIQNRSDHDRDGDGIPNRRDNTPDDPNRN